MSLICKTLRQIYSVFAGTFTGCKMLCARMHLIFWNTCYLFSQVPTVTFSFSSWYLLGIIRKCLWCWCSVTTFEQGVPEVSTPCYASGDRLLQRTPCSWGVTLHIGCIWLSSSTNHIPSRFHKLLRGPWLPHKTKATYYLVACHPNVCG